MHKMHIIGGQPLKGEVEVSGAKNSGLALMFSSLLSEGKHRFHNIPHLRDIQSSIDLLSSLGCHVERDGTSLQIIVGDCPSFEAHYDLVRKMRASFLCLGPLLARFGSARVSLPGGCAIGTRPINLHLEGLRSMGAEIDLHQGYVEAQAKVLHGARILLDFATVGGTENLMMAATLAKGETVIENAAKEPEIVDLATYLRKMGGIIEGEGTSIIRIQGVDALCPGEHFVIPDRIEAATLLCAGAITQGDVTVRGCPPEFCEALLQKLTEAGFVIEKKSREKIPYGESWNKWDQFEISIEASHEWSGVDVVTAPHPGFPTDVQAQFMALMCLSRGTSVISETVFENRFMHVNELLRMGADITPKARVAVVRGQPHLRGASVMATDLRASASLVLAGLAAEGETTVQRIYHLDRGYENLEKKLQKLGGNIRRIEDSD